MGFSDLLTSSRGPGVIGTLLALLVLVGFGTLYLFVFDEGLQGGGKKIEAVIRDQAMVIESDKRQIADFKERIQAGQQFKDQAREIERLKAGSEGNAKSIAKMTSEKESLEQAVAAAEKDWEDYKDAYRQSEWAAAKGERFEELKTLSGKVYKDVRVTSVDHDGMRVMISTGTATLDGKDLPFDLQDRFQFSEEKKEVIVAEREKTFEDLSDDVEIATLKQKGKGKIREIEETVKSIEDAQDAIQRGKAAEPILLGRVDSIRAELAEEQAKQMRRSGSRIQGINKTPQIRERLRVAESRVNSNRKNISSMEKAIRDSKRDKVRLEREVDQITQDLIKLRKEKEAKKAAEAEKLEARQEAEEQ